MTLPRPSPSSPALLALTAFVVSPVVGGVSKCVQLWKIMVLDWKKVSLVGQISLLSKGQGGVARLPAKRLHSALQSHSQEFKACGKIHIRDSGYAPKQQAP